jgi:hypothetical protein
MEPATDGCVPRLARLWHAAAECIESLTRGVFRRKLARERARAHADWLGAALCVDSV